MGIPKFYRWTSERYPCLYEKIREYQIPEFDNLYLDMNGIIHNCSHPNDEDVHLRIPEENIFRDIFHYIDFLFRMIKPCKVFFMAVDGVAPRAKMNQQRGRRFRSARVAEEQEAEAIRQGEKLPSEDRFDSNCITPGTEFMARLNEQLKYFVSVKISTDPLWQRKGLCVYLSGHDVPGEGEHKIMDFIRHIRSKPDFDAETRHCLYGLDADLMMLGLSTHELQFSLLREEVKFSRPKKKKPAKNQQQKKSKHKEENGVVAYDLTNVSVFSSESTIGISNTMLREPAAPGPHSGNLLPIANTDEKSFVDAVNIVPVGTLDMHGKVQQSGLTPVVSTTSNNDNSPPPPPPDDQNAKGDYKAPLPEKTTFFLLHLSLFRDYLDEEFQDLRNNLKTHSSIKYDLECVIDDWILMNILVGNDFVPHLPNLHIVKGALPMLYRTYMDVLPTLDGYLNESGHLNLKRFEAFIRKLSQFDLDQFRDTYDDMKYKASKTGKNIVLGEKMFEDFIFEDCTPFEEEELEPVSDELKALARRTEDEIFGDITDVNGQGTVCKDVFPDENDFFSSDDTEEFRLEFLQHKRNYYLTKCEFNKVDRVAVHEFAQEYVRAIQWVLLYYYKGVSSWGWFYPSHYAPFASDLKNFGGFNIEFAKGQPFKPFEQLLAVLPSQSKKLLPACYQWLMTEDNSPILEYYPKKFEQDLNGKRQDWEAVVLIPFIDENKLLTAMETEAMKLSEEEVFRNARGSLLCCSYTKDSTGPIKSHRDLFPELEVSHVKVDKIYEVTYNPEMLPKGLHPKADVKKIYQGFPSLKSKVFSSCVCKAEVKVFEFYAREESLILNFEDFDEEVDGLKLGRKILGKSVWVNWPHLESCLISSIYTRTGKYVLGRDNLVIKDPKTTEDAARKTFDVMAKGLVERHLKYRGIRLGSLNAILMGRVMEGRKVRCNQVGKVVIENQWSKVEQPYALKTAIYEERVTEMFYMDKDTAKSYLDLYRKGDQVFYLGDKLFGAMGVVVGHDKGSGSVVVELKYPKNSDESNLKLKAGLKQLKSQDFFPPYVTAAKCQISSFALSRLTGRVLVSVEKPKKPSKKSNRLAKKKDLMAGGSMSESSSESDDDFPVLEPEFQKFNIGLDLKFNKTNMEVRGYTSKRDGQWFYSANVVKLVNEFASNFPDVVELLGRTDKSKDVYNAADIFPEDPFGRTNEIVQWLEDRGVRNLTRIPTNCNVLDDDDIDIVWNHVFTSSSTDAMGLQKWSVRPNLLYKPGLDKGCVAPVPNAQFVLLDRVICVDRGASVPLGLRGTVVGIQAPPKNASDDNEESFKSVSSDALNALIIMCDPMPDIFDTLPKSTKNELGDLTELTGSLAKLLGVNGPQKSMHNEGANLKLDVKQNHKPKPKLVKLFPYQVVNLTQGANDLKQDLRKVPMSSQQASGGANKNVLRNGTAIIPMKNFAQAVKMDSSSKAPVSTVKVLQRPNNSSVPSLGTKKNEPLKQVHPVTLPWPPQPMNRSGSITVDQLFSQVKAQHSNMMNHGEKSQLKQTHTVKNSAPPEPYNNSKTKDSKNGMKSDDSKKDSSTPGKKRQPAFVDEIMKAKNASQSLVPKGTKVFVNSALHSKAQDKFENHTSSTIAQTKEEQSKNSILNLLCQPKNMERVKTSTKKKEVDVASTGLNGFPLQTNCPPQPPAQQQQSQTQQFSHPIMLPISDYRNPTNHPQFGQAVMYVNSGPPEYFVPTPYPVVMPGSNPFASAFIPQAPPYPHVPLQAMFPPPPPPQHWTQQNINSGSAIPPGSYHHQQQRRGNHQQSFRQAKGTHTFNIFVPTQVARSMAGTDPNAESNVPLRRKESNEGSKAQAENPVGSRQSQATMIEDATVPATSTLKELLGVISEPDPQSKSVPQQKRKSRIAANFSVSQNS